jgi:hypothetical protein
MPYVKDVCYVDVTRIEREVANTETLAIRGWGLQNKDVKPTKAAA